MMDADQMVNDGPLGVLCQGVIVVARVQVGREGGSGCLGMGGRTTYDRAISLLSQLIKTSSTGMAKNQMVIIPSQAEFCGRE